MEDQDQLSDEQRQKLLQFMTRANRVGTVDAGLSPALEPLARTVRK